MFGLKRVCVGMNQRAVVVGRKTGMTVLDSGRHSYFDPLDRLEISLHNVNEVEFKHPQLERLIKDHSAICRRYLHVVEVGNDEAALIYHGEDLADVLPPGSLKSYWRGPVEVRIEKKRIASGIALPAALIAMLYHLHSVRTDKDAA